MFGLFKFPIKAVSDLGNRVRESSNLEVKSEAPSVSAHIKHYVTRFHNDSVWQTLLDYKEPFGGGMEAPDILITQTSRQRGEDLGSNLLIVLYYFMADTHIYTQL